MYACFCTNHILQLQLVKHQGREGETCLFLIDDTCGPNPLNCCPEGFQCLDLFFRDIIRHDNSCIFVNSAVSARPVDLLVSYPLI